MMKYVVMCAPLLFGVEVLSWLCLAAIAVCGLYDLCVAIDREKGGRW